MAGKRVQFNVRVRQEVARDLRAEAALREIGMGELVELLSENYRAGTRSGHWLELDPPLEAALTALAAIRGEDPERVLQGLVAGLVREQLQGILDHLPSLEQTLDGTVIAALQESPSGHLPETGTSTSDDHEEIEIDASGWIEPEEVELSLPSIELDAVAPHSDPGELVLDAEQWPEEEEVSLGDFEEDERADSLAPPTSPASPWTGDEDRRRRSREVALSPEEQRRFEDLPAGLPRTGDELRRFRQQQGLSPSELGSLCGVTQVAVGLWEKKGPLPAHILLKLGDGLRRYFLR
ncbi:MAG: hypothetical protein CMP23_00190 [Rickettsiales bacterium]|nr:hypothetical protein [Rickettsiales bacterium]|tara:strand:+ start:228 stop:1109 length:882 start_codon:yes stop_codon:yes gene_type:complete